MPGAPHAPKGEIDVWVLRVAQVEVGPFFFSSKTSLPLSLQPEGGGLDPAGAQAPEVDCQLPGHRHDRFLARGPGGERAFGQDSSPFHNRPVLGLEADHPPGQLDQGGPQPRVAVLGHASLEPGLATGVFAWAEAGVASDLAPVAEALPGADLAVDHHAGQGAQTARLVWSGGVLQLQGESPDLGFERQEERLGVAEQFPAARPGPQGW